MHARKLKRAMLAVGMALAVPAVAAAPLFFEGDMVRGGTDKGLTGPACVLTSQFKRGEAVAWRIRVRDQEGRNVDASALESLEALPETPARDLLATVADFVVWRKS